LSIRRIVIPLVAGAAGIVGAVGLAGAQEAPSTTTPPATQSPAPTPTNPGPAPAPAPGDQPGQDGRGCHHGTRGGSAPTSDSSISSRGAVIETYRT
jgi:hypothetical protein